MYGECPLLPFIFSWPEAEGGRSRGGVFDFFFFQKKSSKFHSPRTTRWSKNSKIFHPGAGPGGQTLMQTRVDSFVSVVFPVKNKF